MIFPTLAVATSLLITVAEKIPTIDVDPGCRASAAASRLNQDLEACRKSEASAREQLERQWSTFSAPDRSNCLTLTRTGSNGTYTDLLTCLEIQRDARQLQKEPSLPSTTGQRVR
jgi:hypothetical protein